jgi:hypothetical protein
MAGIMDAWSDEFHKMGTFADDYYRDVITPYKEGVRGKPGFWQSMKNWQPWRAVMPKNWGGTYYTKPTPMASNFLRGAARLGSRALGPASWLMSSPANAGEDEAMARINEQWSQQQNQDRGNYQAPTMSQQGMREEATRTGGTVNPHEATRTFSRPSQPARGPHDYQAGGSVNPHEETTRAAREWSPRGQNYRAEPYRPDLNREITPPMAEPYRPDLNREPTQPFPLGQASSDWNNSGVMLAMNNNPAVKRAKGIYNQVEPYTPDIDWNEKTLGYDFNLPLWGGNLGFEFDYDIDDENYGAGINWSRDLG